MLPTNTAPGNGPMTWPFGKNKDLAVADTETGYLMWAAKTLRLSSGLKAAGATELQRRGVHPPEPAPRPEKPHPPCHRCGPGPGFEIVWGQDAIARKFLRRQC